MNSYENMLQIRDKWIYMVLFADYKNREMQKYYLAVTEKYILKFHFEI